MEGSITKRRRVEVQNPLLLETDRRIRLEETNHIYKYKPDETSDAEIDIRVSSSRVLDMFFGHFFSHDVAAKVEKNSKDGGRYGDLTYPQILDRWTRAANEGTQFHAMAEAYYEIETDEDRQAWDVEFSGMAYRHLIPSFLEFAELTARDGWLPYRSEKVIYDTSDAPIKYPPGTADMIYQRVVKGQTQYYLVDFKTAETEEDFVKTKSPAYASYPLKQVRNSKLYKGHAQCAVYSALFSRYYGQRIGFQAIIAFFWGERVPRYKIFRPERSLIPDAEAMIDLYIDQQREIYNPLIEAVMTNQFNMRFLPSTFKPIK